MSTSTGSQAVQPLPDGYAVLGLNYVLWFAPCASLGLAALLACLRRRRRKDSKGESLDGRRTVANCSKWLLRIERPGDGLFAMEEMGRWGSSLLSILCIVGVLIPWILYAFSATLSGIMCAVESWQLSDSLSYQHMAMGLLLFPATDVRPATVSGKIWCVLIGLMDFVLLHSILGMLSTARINNIIMDLSPQRSGFQAFLLIVLVPLCIVVVGFVVALTLATEGFDLSQGMLGSIDFLTTRGAFGLVDPFGFEWPSGVLFVQLCLIFNMWFGGMIIGIIGTHPSAAALMVFLQGSDSAPGDPAGLDRRMRGFGISRQPSHLSSASKGGAAGGGFRGTLSQQHSRGAMSMETVLQEEAAKARREDEMRSQLGGMGVAGVRDTAMPSETPRRASAWVSAFKAPDVTNPAQYEAEEEWSSGFADSPRGQEEAPGSGEVVPAEDKEALQEKLKKAEKRVEEMEDRTRELQLQLEAAESGQKEAEAKSANLEKQAEAAEKARKELEAARDAVANEEREHTGLPSRPSSRHPSDLRTATAAEDRHTHEIEPRNRARRGSTSLVPRHLADHDLPEPEKDDSDESVKEQRFALEAAEDQVRQLSEKLMEVEERAGRAEEQAEEWMRRAREAEEQLRLLRPPPQGPSNLPREACWGNSYNSLGDLTARLTAPFAAAAAAAEPPLTARLRELQESPLTSRFREFSRDFSSRSCS